MCGIIRQLYIIIRIFWGRMNFSLFIISIILTILFETLFKYFCLWSPVKSQNYQQIQFVSFLLRLLKLANNVVSSAYTMNLNNLLEKEISFK